MDNPIVILRWLVLAVLVAPLAVAILLGLFVRGTAPRGLARSFAMLHFGLTCFVVALAAFDLDERGRSLTASAKPDTNFRPIAVPGDPGLPNIPDSQTNETAWSILRLSTGQSEQYVPAEIQFYLGIDGLNVWLVFLTSLMTLMAVLVSWRSITDRTAGFYAWLFALQTLVTGAFMAFDVVLFYTFFELTLIPVFFLIGQWGVGSGRRAAARKFFLYTLFGSLLTLIGLAGIVITNPTPISPLAAPMYATSMRNEQTMIYPQPGPMTFSISRLMRNVSTWSLIKRETVNDTTRKLTLAQATAEAADRAAAAAPNDAALRRAAAVAADAVAIADRARVAAVAERDSHVLIQTCLFFALMAGFAVKIPILPFHSWLPAAYSEAPIGVTLMLAAVLSKLGTYGVIRIVLPLAPDPAIEYGLPLFGTLGAIGIIYAAFCAFAQRDLKLLLAYSSVSHLGLLLIGLFSFNREGITGASLHMLNHGLTTGAAFALLAFLADRYGTLDMSRYGGLMARYPGYSALTILIALASVGLPGLSNFVSEMLVLAGSFDPVNTRYAGYGIGVAAAAGIFLSAWYTFTMIRRVFFGPLQEPPAILDVVKGLNGREKLAFGLPALLCVALGLYPVIVLDTVKSDAAIVGDTGDLARARAGRPAERPTRAYQEKPKGPPAILGPAGSGPPMVMPAMLQPPPDRAPPLGIPIEGVPQGGPAGAPKGGPAGAPKGAPKGGPAGAPKQDPKSQTG